jgi:DNA modification methylase
MTTPSLLHTEGSASASVLSILVDERLRTDDAEIRIRIEEDLVPSIAEVGLIQPIILERLPASRAGVNINGEAIHSDLLLIAGWSRLAAFSLLKYSTIPYNFRENTPEHIRDEIELEENIRRNEMSWQDIALSIRKIHFKRVSLTAEFNKGKSKSEQMKPWGQRATGSLLNVALGDVSEALLLAEYLKKGDPEITAAANPFAARNVLLTRREDEIAKNLAKKQSNNTNSLKKAVKPQHRVVRTPADERPKGIAETPPVRTLNPTVEPAPKIEIDLSHMLYNLDSIYDQPDGSPPFLARLEPESVDLIYVDPPFGIDMEDLEGRKDIERVAAAHDVGENLDQMEVFFEHAYRVLKDRSYFLQWCDMKNWDKFAGRMTRQKDKATGNVVWKHEKGWLEKAGFTVCPYPMIWHKAHACKNQAAGVWPTKSYEYVCVARKGKANLLKPIPDSVFRCSGTSERKLQANPFAKPFEFTKWLLDYFVRPGSVVLDCYAGEGSIVRALLNLGMTVIACEKEETHYNRLVEHVKKHFKALHGDEVEFI